MANVKIPLFVEIQADGDGYVVVAGASDYDEMQPDSNTIAILELFLEVDKLILDPIIHTNATLVISAPPSLPPQKVAADLRQIGADMSGVKKR